MGKPSDRKRTPKSPRTEDVKRKPRELTPQETERVVGGRATIHVKLGPEKEPPQR